MSEPPPETTQDITQTKRTYPVQEQNLHFLTPPGIETGRMFESMDSTDHSTTIVLRLYHLKKVILSCLLQGISTLKSAGPHAIQGKRVKVKTPLTNQAINHLAVSASITHSGQKRAEFTSLCKLLCCYKITLPPSQHRCTCSNIATLWDIVCLFLALAISDWLLPRTPLHLRAW